MIAMTTLHESFVAPPYCDTPAHRPIIDEIRRVILHANMYRLLVAYVHDCPDPKLIPVQSLLLYEKYALPGQLDRHPEVLALEGLKLYADQVNQELDIARSEWYDTCQDVGMIAAVTNALEAARTRYTPHNLTSVRLAAFHYLQSCVSEFQNLLNEEQE